MSLTGLISIVASPLSLNSGSFSIPEGWLLCDGRSYLKSDYINLYNHLLKDGPNSIYSSTNEPLYGGDADNFNVPDLNNRFMRGWKNGSQNLQPGQNISEKIDISGISVEPSISQLSLTVNSAGYSPISQSISSEGHHTHQYARDGGSGGISLESTGLENYDNGFFHTRPAQGSQLQTSGRPVHLRDDRSGAVQEICSLDNDVEHYSMWSIIQGGSQGYQLTIPDDNNTLVYWQGQFQQQDMAELSIRRRTFVSMKNPIWQNSNQRVWNHNEYQSNTAIRHIHKYTINVFHNGDHQHTASSSPQNHTHDHTISTTPTVQSTGANGQELRPANTKMVFLIYAL